MGITPKTVFISYRRTNFYTALAVYQDLTANGYDCFFDYESIESGDFETVIFENIRYRAHFVVILSPSALERLGEKNSVMRREVELAIDEKRNIIPLMMESFDFGSPSAKAALTGKLESLSSYNGLKFVPEYIFAGMEKLRRFLNVELEAVHQPGLSAAVEEDTEKRLAKAKQEATVQEEALTAEKWFERAYMFGDNGNFQEAILCYNASLQISSNVYSPYVNLGVAFSALEHYEKAEEAYRKAISINPSRFEAHGNLGNLLRDHFPDRLSEAEVAYRKAIEINPEDFRTHYNLGLLLHKLKRYGEAEEAYIKATRLNPKNAAIYYRLSSLYLSKLQFIKSFQMYVKSFYLSVPPPISVEELIKKRNE